MHTHIRASSQAELHGFRHGAQGRTDFGIPDYPLSMAWRLRLHLYPIGYTINATYFLYLSDNPYLSDTYDPFDEQYEVADVVNVTTERSSALLRFTVASLSHDRMKLLVKAALKTKCPLY